MKTLVIHPKDYSTDFLSVIYAGKGWTVIDYDMSRSSLEKEIKGHDRIIMLGHGDGDGLFGFGKRVINSSTAYYLKNKSNVYIWCYADKFVNKHRLKGFHTGMIISEYDEAIMFLNSEPSYQDIVSSNKLFADSISESIDLDLDMMYKSVKEKYSTDNLIVEFNKSNIFYK